MPPPTQAATRPERINVLPTDLEGRLTITVPEAGNLLGLGRGSAYGAARRGEIPTLKIGGRLVVPVPRLLELLGHVPPGSAPASGVAAEEAAA